MGWNWDNHPVGRKESATHFMLYHTPQYAVGWFTLALINAGLAQAKNRSGLGWFLGSLFLGPIATLIIVLLDKAKQA
jgi:hypothetical protein